MSRRGQGPDWEWRDGAVMLSAIAVCCLVVGLVGTAGASVAADPKPPELVAVDTAAQTDESGDRFEPNDRQSTATGVETGESYDGLSIHTAGDRDYFAVGVDAGETIAADVAFAHAAGDLDVGLVDGSGTVLASSLSVSDDESLTHAVDTAGTYYVVVYGYDGATNDYALSVETGASTAGGDQFEPNDDPTKATDFGNGSSVSGLEITDGTDEDYFAVDAEAGDVVAVETTFTHADGDLDLALLGPSGALLAESISVTDDERIQYTAGSDGTYYVLVYGYDGATNDYDIAVESPVVSDIDGRLEPDNNRTAATPMGSGGTESDLDIATTYDRDYFAVETVAGETISADVSFTHADGDLDVALLNATGGVIETSESAADTERVEHTAAESGTYFLVVYGYEGATNSYDVSVTTTGTDANVAPTAVASLSDTAVWRNDTVTLDGSNTTDGDGITGYAWDVDGDGTTEYEGRTATHTFETAGAYDVTLTVTDADGATATDTVAVAVESPESCSDRDGDDDGLTGCEEAEVGTDPTVADTDGDGFPDGAEVERSDLLPDADPLQFDVYVEVDYIDENPMSEGDYERIRAGLDSEHFRNPNGETGIRLHVVEGEAVERVGSGNDPAAYQRAYQNETYACAGYHYAMVTGEQPWATALGVGSPGRFIVTENSTGDTFMHELGHALGLGYRGSGGELHGTFEYPWQSYRSVMNYNFPPMFPLAFSDGTESRIAHDDWGYLNESAYTPGWDAGC